MGGWVKKGPFYNTEKNIWNVLLKKENKNATENSKKAEMEGEKEKKRRFFKKTVVFENQSVFKTF